MGNCFGKESSASDNFATTGRAVGSAPPQPAPRAAVPKISGQGRSLGGGQALDSTDARAAAAKAAEVYSLCCQSRMTVYCGDAANARESLGESSASEPT